MLIRITENTVFGSRNINRQIVFLQQPTQVLVRATLPELPQAACLGGKARRGWNFPSGGEKSRLWGPDVGRKVPPCPALGRLPQSALGAGAFCPPQAGGSRSEGITTPVFPVISSFQKEEPLLEGIMSAANVVGVVSVLFSLQDPCAYLRGFI